MSTQLKEALTKAIKEVLETSKSSSDATTLAICLGCFVSKIEGIRDMVISNPTMAHIAIAIQDCGGNKTEAAIKLGITRRELYSILAKNEARQ